MYTNRVYLAISVRCALCESGVRVTGGAGSQWRGPLMCGPTWSYEVEGSDGVSAWSHVIEKERGTEGDTIATVGPGAVVEEGSGHGVAVPMRAVGVAWRLPMVVLAGCGHGAACRWCHSERERGGEEHP